LAKKAFVYDGTQWVDIAQSTADLSNYANMTTTPISGFRNAIINGDFRINQRAFLSVTTSNTYGFDRWKIFNAGGTVTYTPQAFTLGSPAQAGYESNNFARLVSSGQSASSDYAVLQQPIEGVRTFANSTVTVSFWAKANSGAPKVAVELAQIFGAGASADVNVLGGQVTLSTSWDRYSVQVTLPSISGKTVTTNNALNVNLWTSGGTNYNSRLNSLGIQNNTFDFWGVQVERGTVATPFEQRPIGLELTLCQRYFYRLTPGTAYGMLTMFGNAVSGSAAYPMVQLPTTMRIPPTAVGGSALHLTDLTNNYTIFVLSIYAPGTSTDVVQLEATTSGLTQYRAYAVRNANNTAGYIDFFAEL
jgi:hypothetical protein